MESTKLKPPAGMLVPKLFFAEQVAQKEEKKFKVINANKAVYGFAVLSMPENFVMRF